ncbi:MAG: hypothetical protein PHN20_04400, partial [Bacteroidales bacterium]|nr:hypothetical protein [Bacteroidales bacterium]
MKTKWSLLVTMLALTSSVALSKGSFNSDDLYYDPRQDTKSEETEIVKEMQVEPQKQSIRVYDATGTLRVRETRDVDEYNRRYTNDTYKEEVDTVYEEEVYEEQGTDVAPFEYSERVRRFHNP